jgi:type I restriction enzyme M protein
MTLGKTYTAFIEEHIDSVTEGVNERDTENIIRDAFRLNQEAYPDVVIYEQKTNDARITKLLKQASKQGAGGGKPEFIVTFNIEKELLIIVECKADILKHESADRKHYKDYAVDGVLLYSAYLSKEFDVISIAISGDKSNYKTSHFIQLRGQPSKEVQTSGILSFDDYIKLYKHDPVKIKLDILELMRYSRKLHNNLRDVAKLTEPEKALLVSAILMALTDDGFVASYPKKKTAADLSKLLISTIKEIVEHAKLPETKIQTMLHPFTFIQVHPELIKDEDMGKPVHILYDFIKDIETNVKPFADQYPDYDILGHFFGEFLRYAGGEKKGLGIVLTPRHITELFADLTDVKKNDVVFDNCCGTGGFLIAAMKKMIADAKGDSNLIRKIKASQLIGIEPRPDMFALACANMILRGDGKANLYRESCFSLLDKIKQNHDCTIGFLNPPYSQKGEGLSELDFVQNCLDALQKNCTCIAILPISCATTPSPQKERLLKNHTLEAAMSMPDELFSPVGVITCILVFKAKVPHNPMKKTWFGYWKDDGFEKTRTEGRIDKDKKWENIKARWIDNYLNRREIDRECILHEVTAANEWVAEAYLTTDYSKITKEEFLQSVKEYAVFKMRNEI